jgi:6,7-dimethyl-8-ribityllumazine synthase
MTEPVSAIIIAAEFNKPVIDVMVKSAAAELEQLGVKVLDTARVPGSYELPLLASSALARPDVSLVVVLGYIERGETQHGEVMGHVVHKALVDLELEHGKPVGLGIIGPGATPPQAEARKEGYARAAARAAVVSMRENARIGRGA